MILSELIDDMVRWKLSIIEVTFQNEWLGSDWSYLATGDVAWGARPRLWSACGTGSAMAGITTLPLRCWG